MNEPCTCGINLIWLWYIILLYISAFYLWILCWKFCWKMRQYMLWKILICIFPFLQCLCLVLVLGVNRILMLKTTKNRWRNSSTILINHVVLDQKTQHSKIVNFFKIYLTNSAILTKISAGLFVQTILFKMYKERQRNYTSQTNSEK